MKREPSAEDIEEKLIELAYAWGDIESVLLERSTDEILPEIEDIVPPELIGTDAAYKAVEKAFRVEAVYGENDFGDPCTFYVLLFDVADSKAREQASVAEDSRHLRELILETARPWHDRDFLIVRRVSTTVPTEGEICRRWGEKHPVQIAPSLDDVPPYKPSAGSVELMERPPHWMTPIEAPFYDALSETGLTFSVQPWVEGPNGRYRLDFLAFYDGGAIGVELDGHEWHKTKEQRSKDAARDRWFQARRISIVRFTGSQVFADVQGCVSELLNVVRASQARP